MDERLFEILLAIISIIGIIITRHIVPYIKTKISANQLEELTEWVARAVEAAEVLFDAPKSGDAKREYVINFINEKFNSKKTVITEEQIRIILESVWKNMTETEE